jgi:DUF4097 and DUF4098 domain-containing protein YvlB
VETGSGDLRATTVGGALSVRTGSGDILVTTVSGRVTANVASGDIAIEEAGGPVRASTASGDLRIECVHGDNLRVNSASGDVAVGVPFGTKVWLDLTTMSGTTTSDLEMIGPPPEGRAQLKLQVRTLSGNIHVYRASASQPARSPAS